MRTPPGLRPRVSSPKRAAGGGEERLLERRRAVLRLQLVDARARSALLCRVPTRSASASASASHGCRTGSSSHVRLPDLADELLHLGFERGSSPVVGSSRSRSTGDVRSARAKATFCCIPRERFSIASPPCGPSRKPTLWRISGSTPSSPTTACRRTARRSRVLLGRHLLEERRLDRPAVDELAHRTALGVHVVAEDAGAAAVVEQQGREQADERRLPDPFWPRMATVSPRCMVVTPFSAATLPSLRAPEESRAHDRLCARTPRAQVGRLDGRNRPFPRAHLVWS